MNDELIEQAYDLVDAIEGLHDWQTEQEIIEIFLDAVKNRKLGTY
jgi:hypothetical protein